MTTPTHPTPHPTTNPPTEAPRLEEVDFGLQELPGETLHQTLRAFRER